MWNIQLDLETTKSLGKGMPKLQSLQMDFTLWEADAFDCFRNGMATNTSINTIGIYLPREDDANILYRSVQTCLEQNKVLEHLEMREVNDNTRFEAFERICNGMKANRTLEDLCLVGSYRTDPATLIAMESNGPKCLTLKGINVNAQTNPEKQPSLSTTSRIEELTIQDCNMDQSSFLALLSHCVSLPILKMLLLTYNGEDDDASHLCGADITEPIVKIHKRNILETLEFQRSHMNIRAICEVLKLNTSLTKYHVDTTCQDDYALHLQCMKTCLRDHNTTLTDVEVIHYYDQSGNAMKACPLFIQIHTFLNQCGRAEIHNAAFSRKDLVRLLSSANQISFGPVYSNNLNSILFGFLRERPKVWCNAFPTEKQLRAPATSQ